LIERLFRGLLFALGQSESLRLFAARRAFSHVISALAVSHNSSTLTLSPPLPSCFAASIKKIRPKKSL
jgi:hypothetical protein